jgi:predicted NAD/FAD-binding protein
LKELGVGDWFRDYYLLPMAGSIWSCPVDKMLEFPASTLIRFFHNHGLLTVNDQPQWFTVQGGAKEYVKRIIACLGEQSLRPGATGVVREEGEIRVLSEGHEPEVVDHVVFACHANEALELLSQPSQEEQAILSKFTYQKNDIVLHSDAALMPIRKKAWASWAYLLEGRQDERKAISLSYWMNNLQSKLPDIPLIVTLNAQRQPEESLVYDRHTFEHPVFDQPAIEGQREIADIQGQQNTWFCGAYQRYGFHEDGLWSARRVAEKMGVLIPWS